MMDELKEWIDQERKDWPNDPILTAIFNIIIRKINEIDSAKYSEALTKAGY